ncbi:hypothetical protein KFE98_07545 [bacterium SCSIO 12741]|nr:hypothetical protein KFE98_07545 [bacterium SCSIO 12741]
MKRSALIVSLTVLSASLFFSSCEKAKQNRSTDTSEDYSLSQAMSDDLYKVIDQASSEEAGVRSSGSLSCATITLSPALPDSTFPKTLTIDFGSSNCTGNDGIRRRGIVQVEYTGRYRDEGTQITATTTNYYVNDHQVIANKKVKNAGRNSSGNLHFAIEVDGKVITSDGNEIVWHSARSREWIAGENTTWWSHGWAGVTDDVYSINGQATGTNRNGKNYSAIITKALIYQVGCRWIKEGTLEIQPDDLTLRKVDFGSRSEGCNNQATVEIGNRSYDIEMR